MSQSEGSGYCPECRRNVLVRRKSTNHVLHLLITLLACGFWLPIWALIALCSGGNWRCSRCGCTDIRD